jgi:hypothetical protein
VWCGFINPTNSRLKETPGLELEQGSVGVGVVVARDENGTEIFQSDRFRFLYYELFFNIKNCQFQLVSQLFSTIFCTL